MGRPTLRLREQPRALHRARHLGRDDLGQLLLRLREDTRAPHAVHPDGPDDPLSHHQGDDQQRADPHGPQNRPERPQDRILDVRDGQGPALPQDPRHRRVPRDGDLHAQPGGRARRVVFGHHHQVIPFLRHQGDRPPIAPEQLHQLPDDADQQGLQGDLLVDHAGQTVQSDHQRPGRSSGARLQEPGQPAGQQEQPLLRLRRPQGGGPLGGEHAHGLPVLPGAQGEIQADGRHSRRVQRLDRGPAGTIGPHGPAGGLAGEGPLQDPGGGRQRPRPDHQPETGPLRIREPQPQGDRMPRGAQRRCRLPEHLLGIRRPQEAVHPLQQGIPDRRRDLHRLKPPARRRRLLYHHSPSLRFPGSPLRRPPSPGSPTSGGGTPLPLRYRQGIQEDAPGIPEGARKARGSPPGSPGQAGTATPDEDVGGHEGRGIYPPGGGGKFKSDPADEAFAPGNPKRGDPKGLPLHSQGMDPATQRHAFHRGPFLTALPKPLMLY
jgi:hypothetical protein